MFPFSLSYASIHVYKQNKHVYTLITRSVGVESIKKRVLCRSVCAPVTLKQSLLLINAIIISTKRFYRVHTVLLILFSLFFTHSINVFFVSIVYYYFTLCTIFLFEFSWFMGD